MAALLMAPIVDEGAVRLAMGQFCALPDDAAHEVLADAWRRVRFTGNPVRWEFAKATLMLLDAMLHLSPAVRLVAATGMAEVGQG